MAAAIIPGDGAVMNGSTKPGFTSASTFEKSLHSMSSGARLPAVVADVDAAFGLHADDLASCFEHGAFERGGVDRFVTAQPPEHFSQFARPRQASRMGRENALFRMSHRVTLMAAEAMTSASFFRLSRRSVVAPPE